MRIKSFFTLTIFILSLSRAQSQNFWEILLVPDTFAITTIALNQNGDLFLGSISDNHKDGIFKTSNYGLSWEKLYAMNGGPASIVISSAGSIYALGFKEGEELLKSTDNGESWDVMDVPECMWNQKLFLKGEDTLFISQWRGDGAYLLRSVDAGQNWDLVFQDFGTQYIKDMAFGTDGSIYIGLMCYMPDNGGIFKSSDGGDNWEFIGLHDHQVSSISIDTSNNLLITVWSNMVNSSISGNIYYNHVTDEFSPIYYAWGAYSSAVNSGNDFFTTYNFGALHSKDVGITYELLGGDTAAGCELYLSPQEYLYGFAPYYHYLVKSTQPTITSSLSKRIDENSLRILPNPVKNQLIGKINTTSADSEGEVSIMDITGKCILQTVVHIVNSSFTVDVSILSKGLYFVHLCTNGSMYSVALVKS